MATTDELESRLDALRAERDATNARLRAEIQVVQAELDVAYRQAELDVAVAVADERKAKAQQINPEPATLGQEG